jgi:hypothetical protein
MVKAHKDGTATFDELDFSDQASSINAQMLNFEASIKANIKRAAIEGRKNPKEKRIANLKELIKRLEAFEI